MKKNPTNNISESLNRFHRGKMTPEEFAQMKDAVNHASDEELHTVLKAQWDAFNDFEELAASKKEQLFQGISQRTRRPFMVSLRTKWMQIAAALVFLLMGTWMVNLYVENTAIQEIAEQNIVIRSGDTGHSSVTLPDGTKVLLNAKSELVYKRDFGMADRKVALKGEGYFEVERNEEKRFIVQTGYMDVEVFGTKFNVYAYENRDFVEMSLVEGSVQVRAERPPYKSFKVKPNEKVTFNKLTGEMVLESTDNSVETAWIQKELVFRNDKLRDVFQMLEYKFGVTIHAERLSFLEDSYTGVFDDDKIDGVMKVLQMHYDFTYRIVGNEVYIEE